MNIIEQAIVRTPSGSFWQGLTPGLLGKADAALAKKQHSAYIAALEAAGIPVKTLPEMNDFPDSCFVEDPAIVTDRVAILTNPATKNRNGETARIEPTIREIYGDRIERIEAPGTLEGGDICRAEDHFFIGLSKRTNRAGADQLAAIVARYGFTYDFVSILEIQGLLHLKTGLSYIGDRTVIGLEAILAHPAFASYRRISVDPGEEYAANCIRLGDAVLFPEGFPKTRQLLIDAGFKVTTIQVSEFRKQDGGLSCLSLRLPSLSF